jgi:VWFA-related protein
LSWLRAGAAPAAWLRSAIAAVAVAGSSAAAPDPAPPTFPAEADLVRVDIVVRDRRGRPVEDLGLGEIQILEDGVRCPARSFAIVRPRSSERDSRPEASGTEPGSPIPEAPPMPSLVLLVFDQLSLEAALSSQKAALDFVGRAFPADSYFAVFKIGAGLTELSAFTGEREATAKAIVQATYGSEGASPPAVGAAPVGSSSETLELPTSAGSETPDGRAVQTLRGLTAEMLRLNDAMAREERGISSVYPLLAIARGLRQVAGRKTLLYFSEGIHVPPALAEAFQTAVSEANRSNLSVYCLDARGLAVQSTLAASKAALPLSAAASTTAQRHARGPVAKESVRAAEMAHEALRLDIQGNLRELAEGTGGFLVANANDLRPGLDRVASDLASYYEVGYVPPNPVADGRFRRVEVRVSRSGTSVRSRRGYYALPAEAPLVLPYELPLRAALSATPSPRELDYRSAALIFPAEGGRADCALLVEVPLAGLRIEREPGAGISRAHLSLLGVVRGDAGETVARVSQDWPQEMAGSRREGAARRTATFRRNVRLAPGRYTFETALQDRKSRRIGVRRTAFLVPGGDGLTLGTVSALRRAEAAGEATAGDPLRVGDLLLVPSLGAPFEEGTETIGFLVPVRPGPGSDAVAIDLEFRREGETISTVRGELPPPDASGSIRYLGSLATERLLPGRYQIWARARQGDAEAVEATSFEIVPRSVRGGGSVPAAARPAAEGARRESARPVAGELAPVLQAAGRYVVRFETSFARVVTEEQYRQWADRRVRTLRSDLVFVSAPREIPWALFRDVYEVDGQRVRDRDARLQRLFMDPSATTLERANAILHESARYNLGAVYRNVNTPTLPLAFLHPKNQWRFSFERKGTRWILGRQGVEVAYSEQARPTLVRGLDGESLPAKGRFWIAPEDGVVLRAEAAFRFRVLPSTPLGVASALTALFEAAVATEFRPEPGFEIWVPAEMKELHLRVGSADDREETGDRIEGTARYSKYRRFEVTTEEKLRHEAQPAPWGSCARSKRCA